MAKMSTEAFRARENNLLNRIQNDDIEAYRLLGDLYYKGPSGNENNENRAYTYWIQAADKGDPIAAGNVGIRMIQGVYGEEKRSEAYPYLKAAVKYADKYGSASMSAPFFWLGEAYASGIGCEYDLSTAEAFYTAAAQRNYPAAQLSLALLILNHKDSTDKTGLRWLCCAHINGNRKATKLLETKIKAPNPAWTQGEVDKTISDIFESGLFPISGIGFSQQIFEEIIQENKEQAARGSVLTMRLLGDLLRSGFDNNGTGKDDIQANIYYEKAASRGDAESARKLGQYYLSMDDNKAFQYISKAAEGGDPKAKYILGVIYRLGIGCNANPHKAVQILTPIALLNHGNSQFELFKAMMDTRIEERTVDDKVHNLEISFHAIHWLACAYVNGVDDAIKTAKELNMESDSMFQNKMSAIKKYGVDESKYPNEEKKTESTNNAFQMSNQQGNGDKEGCFIATCVYGSYDCPNVWVLRRFRDETLRKTFLGNQLINIYYALSPGLVKRFGRSQLFLDFWKAALDFLVYRLKENGFNDSFYSDPR